LTIKTDIIQTIDIKNKNSFLSSTNKRSTQKIDQFILKLDKLTITSYALFLNTCVVHAAFAKYSAARYWLV